MTSRDHTLLACLLAIMGLYMVHLSGVEIQPWDEGLYAIRGESIAVYNEWWDQTPHALGGSYSSTAPPMASWGVALGINLFGRNALGVRLFTVLCSAVSLWLIYLIGKRFLSFQGAILAVCVLGASTHWVIYSRQAMTEVPLVMFVLLALWSVAGGMPRHAPTLAFALAGALLTKMAVSLLPLLFVIPLLRDKRTRWWAVGAVVGGIALAAPWYAMMLSRYGGDFWMAMTVPHVHTAIEGNAGSLGMLYYVNQLVVSHPLLVVSFLYLGVAMFRRNLLPSRDHNDVWNVLVWFVATMLIFSIARTKNMHYTVMILPAAVLVAVYALETIVAQGPRRLTMVMLTLSVVATTYAWMPGLRTALKDPAMLVQHPIYLIVAIVSVVSVIATLTLPLTIIDTWSIRTYRPIVSVVAAMAFLRVISIVWVGPEGQIQGGREVAVALMERSSAIKHFTYLYHEHNAGDALNPQLAWYTAGWMNGWDDRYSYEPVGLPEKLTDLNTIASVAVGGSSWVVYYHPGITDGSRMEVMAGLAALYDVTVKTDHYTLFQLR